MKNRKFNCLVAVVLTVICVLFACGLFSSCNISLDDYIPETLGEPEGLYLYNGNIRSFTDGSEPTEILSEIVLDDTVYGPDEFEIKDIAYITETHEIFYTVSVDGRFLVWHVNYKSKASEFLYEFPECERTYLQANNYYVLVQGNSTGVLFDKNAEIVDGSFCDFTLNKDALYRVVDHTFEFWKDGKLTKIDIQLQPRHSNIFYLGNYFYMFGDKRAVSVSLNTGETEFFDLAENSKGSVYSLYRSYVMDDILFFILNGDLNTLWKAENGTFEVVHTYSDENCGDRQADCYIYETTDLSVKDYGKGIINFTYSCCWKRNDGYWYHDHNFYYDAESGEVKEAHKAIPKSEPETLNVGDYKFYIVKRYYGHPLWGSFIGETGNYYYLYREKGEEKVIMQYKYISSSDRVTAKMYDDICEF